MRHLLSYRLVLALTMAILTSACGTVPMGKPQASIDNVRAAKSAGIAATALGPFVLASARNSDLDTSVGIRATSLTAPNGSFAGYLKETLEADLAAAGLLNPASSWRIDGFLTDRQVDASMNGGSGLLAARFVVTKAGTVAYDRELSVTATWESSFVGAIAIPTAINEFTALFRKLVTKLLADPEFRKAMAG